HHPTLSKALARLTDNIELENGLTIWNNLRWYPVILLCYSSGIAAIANSRYENLYAIFNAAVTIRQKSPTSSQLAVVIADEISELERSEAFKRLPGHERFFVPRSEYLFKLLQPELDDDLFLGKEYEVVFDRFEMVLALFIAVGRKRLDRHLWGPVGRFGWKMSSRIRGTNPFTELLQEAEQSKENWPPFKAGLFGSDLELFMKTAADYEKLIGNLHWW
ncbi:MAG TPA: caspase family protein, partial [Verrucomicrobiae bacterium]|nr:caspase family protein [Verrucomicrobiae bacterium]